MSANGNDDGEEIPGREIAYRLFAAEYDDASMSYAESDEERAPNYVISPTGARLNRLFAVGTLTEVTSVNEEMVRARIVDPTGAFVVYAGQYQPDALATLEQLEAPAFVAVTGKARTFQPDDSDQVYTSIRPESIATVDADTRDRWVVSAAEQTLDRVGTYAAAADLGVGGDALTDALREAGSESGLAAGIPLAQDHYGTTPAYLAALRECALEAVEVVAGERDQVSGLSLQPGGSSPEYESATFESLADFGDTDLGAPESVADPAEAAETTADSQPTEAVAAAAGGSETESGADVDAGAESITTGSAAGTATGTDRNDASDAESEAASDVSLDADSSPAADAAVESGDETDETGASEPETGPEDAVAGDGNDSETDEPTAEFDEETDVEDTSADETDDDADGEEELDDFDPDEGGMYEMDDDEREQLEEEFGAEFTTGGEVDEPGEADIDVPEPETEPEADDSEAPADSTVEDASPDDGETAGDDDLGAPPESGLEAESEAESEPDDEPDTDADEEPAEDVDLEEYVVETMADLDDGDGADRTELVETVAADTGASEDDVEDAIQDALMGGQCYEPNDETLKPI
ncbi:hypothetical protein [Natronorubrum halophilum]|uniref:hypothetical protein n=1 Tax=Natronorubrum halophilum TaxID=1702106 RepID=UPI0010C1BDD5|nr:hypothetical protein [Natronorubrum halophilum]